MKKHVLRERGKSGWELIEEGFVVLRTCPPSLLALYFLGTIPFATGLLVFCSTLAAGSPDTLGPATLGMTGLFIWMKFFQSRFGQDLLERLSGNDPAPTTIASTFLSAARQTIVHASGLVVLPVSALLCLPFGWVAAFYQNTTVLENRRSGLKELFQAAKVQACLWPGQNHIVLTFLSAFGLGVFINWITLGFLAPQLLKMFFGVETPYSQSPLSLLNSTFFAAVIVLTYLCVDPLARTCYVLRCFYGRSRRSGDDLKMELRRFSLVAMLFCLLASGTTALAESTPPDAAPARTTELNTSIDQVMQQDKYQWRAPREKSGPKEDGWLAGFFRNVFETIGDAFEAIVRQIERFVRWITDYFRPQPSFDPGPGWILTQSGLLYGILAVVACVAAVLFLRLRKNRDQAVEIEGIAAPLTPDLENENTTATDLPEDDWTRLGRQYAEQGEWRLSVRAFYLASLAHLASRGLITVARFKSNREYEKELLRRGHSLPALPALFAENLGIFERTWYGLHTVDADVVSHFIQNLNQIKSAG